MTGSATSLEVIILAGGKGTRLQTVVSDVPKPLAEVNGHPFLDYHFRQLARFPQVAKVILAVGHLAHRIVEHYEAHAPALPYAISTESQPLGTAGAIRHALPLTTTESVMVLNGDSIFDLDVAGLLALHRETKRGVTMALLAVDDASRYGRVEVEGERVTAFREKLDQAEPGLINAGAYVFDREVLAVLPPGSSSLERELLPQLVADGRVAAQICQSDFIDIGLPETFRAAGAFVTRLFKGDHF